MHHFMVIVEWERQRRADLLKSDPDGYYYSDEDDEDEEENQPNFLQARAQKAAHFAQRELELQQTRKQREQRKAQLVAESGGLKYTAMAMANMHTDDDAGWEVVVAACGRHDGLFVAVLVEEWIEYIVSVTDE